VARNIPVAAMVAGNYVIVAIPGGNPKDAVVIAAWPGGSAGSGMEEHGNEYHDPDFEEEGVAAALTELHRATAEHTQPQPSNFLKLSDTPSSYSGQAGRVPRVNSAENALEFAGPGLLAELVRLANFQMIPTAAGWNSLTGGSGSNAQQPFRNYVAINGTAGSYSNLYAPSYGFNEGNIYQQMNWDKELWLIFNYARYSSQAAVKAWVQIEDTNAGQHQDLATKGIGIVLKNGDIYGESYGTSRAEHSLGYTLNMANQEQVQIAIHLTPTGVEWYVNGVLKATEQTAGKYPTGITASGGVYLNHAIYDGGVATSGLTVSNMMQGKIWQSRQ